MGIHGEKPGREASRKGARSVAWRGVAAALAVVFALGAAGANAQGQGAQPPSVFSLSGILRTEEGTRLEGILVEVQTQSGQVIDRLFTRSQGDFEFRGLRSGLYLLMVQLEGYETIREQVEIYQSSRRVQYFLRRIDSGMPKAEAAARSVSARELALPGAARKAWEKGLEELGKGNAKGSVKQFERVLKDAPDFYEAHCQLGVAYSLLQKPEEAEGQFRRALKMSGPGYADPYFGLAGLETEKKQYAEAEKLAREGMAVDDPWSGYYELARAQYGLNRLEEALKNAEEAKRRQPKYSQVYLVLANIHMKRMDYPAMLEVLNQFLELEPKGPMSDQVRQTRDQLQQEFGKASGNSAKKDKN